MSEDEFKLLLSFFKALANESRMKMVGILATREASVSELATLLELRDPTVSHHLAKLRALGLVASRDEGTVRYYSLVPDALDGLAKRVLAPEATTVMAATVDHDKLTDKVLRAFTDGERITRIPAARKKRDLVLDWLVERFELEREYPEKEVNEILLVAHWDSATLRRELVDGGWMKRERGIYERLR